MILSEKEARVLATLVALEPCTRHDLTDCAIGYARTYPQVSEVARWLVELHFAEVAEMRKVPGRRGPGTEVLIPTARGREEVARWAKTWGPMLPKIAARDVRRNTCTCGNPCEPGRGNCPECLGFNDCEDDLEAIDAF